MLIYIYFFHTVNPGVIKTEMLENCGIKGEEKEQVWVQFYELEHLYEI